MLLPGPAHRFSLHLVSSFVLFANSSLYRCCNTPANAALFPQTENKLCDDPKKQLFKVTSQFSHYNTILNYPVKMQYERSECESPETSLMHFGTMRIIAH